MGKRRRRGTGKKRADKGFSVSSKCSEYGRYPGNVQGSTCWIYGRQPFQDALSCYEGHHEKIDGTPSGLESDLRSACDLLRRQDTGITFSSWQSNSTMLICSRDRLLSQSVSSYALLLHYFMFTQNSGLTLFVFQNAKNKGLKYSSPFFRSFFRITTIAWSISIHFTT